MTKQQQDKSLFQRILESPEATSKIKLSRMNQVYECVSASDGVGLTAREIAGCVGLSAGGWSKTILHELEDRGWLRHEVVFIQTNAGLREGARYFAIEKPIQNEEETENEQATGNTREPAQSR